MTEIQNIKVVPNLETDNSHSLEEIETITNEFNRRSSTGYSFFKKGYTVQTKNLLKGLERKVSLVPSATLKVRNSRQFNINEYENNTSNSLNGSNSNLNENTINEESNHFNESSLPPPQHERKSSDIITNQFNSLKSLNEINDNIYNSNKLFIYKHAKFKVKVVNILYQDNQRLELLIPLKTLSYEKKIKIEKEIKKCIFSGISDLDFQVLDKVQISRKENKLSYFKENLEIIKYETDFYTYTGKVIYCKVKELDIDQENNFKMTKSISNIYTNNKFPEIKNKTSSTSKNKHVKFKALNPFRTTSNLMKNSSTQITSNTSKIIFPQMEETPRYKTKSDLLYYIKEKQSRKVNLDLGNLISSKNVKTFSNTKLAQSYNNWNAKDEMKIEMKIVTDYVVSDKIVPQCRTTKSEKIVKKNLISRINYGKGKSPKNQNGRNNLLSSNESVSNIFYRKNFAITNYNLSNLNNFNNFNFNNLFTTSTPGSIYSNSNSNKQISLTSKNFCILDFNKSDEKIFLEKTKKLEKVKQQMYKTLEVTDSLRDDGEREIKNLWEMNNELTTSQSQIVNYETKKNISTESQYSYRDLISDNKQENNLNKKSLYEEVKFLLKSIFHDQSIMIELFGFEVKFSNNIYFPLSNINEDLFSKNKIEKLKKKFFVFSYLNEKLESKIKLGKNFTSSLDCFYFDAKNNYLENKQIVDYLDFMKSEILFLRENVNKFHDFLNSSLTKTISSIFFNLFVFKKQLTSYDKTVTNFLLNFFITEPNEDISWIEASVELEKYVLFKLINRNCPLILKGTFVKDVLRKLIKCNGHLISSFRDQLKINEKSISNILFNNNSSSTSVTRLKGGSNKLLQMGDSNCAIDEEVDVIFNKFMLYLK